MNALLAPLISWTKDVARAWDRFWFQPALPYTLAAIRILGGAMLLYTHAVWTIGLNDFLGTKSWLSSEASSLLNRGPAKYNFAFSYLYWVESPTLLWTLHIAALIFFALLTLGLFTRVASVLAFVIAISYVHRLNGTLFGLDQINIFIAMYLMLGDSGAVWSLDRWIATRRKSEAGLVLPAVSTNIAVRQPCSTMIQVASGATVSAPRANPTETRATARLRCRVNQFVVVAMSGV
jgi:hypothetical protein